jgi:uncharacterized protein (DUF1697 family)
MPRFVAFLRAINVGGHTVKMEQLRLLFEALRHSNVETFIASGNVIFEARSDDVKKLETNIERQLQKSLGYAVVTFVRSIDELAGIAGYEPFSAADLGAEGNSLYIAFLPAPPHADGVRKLMALRTEADEFNSHGREIYWLRRRGFSESALAGGLFEKTVGMPATMRNATTVRKLAAKYCGDSR